MGHVCDGRHGAAPYGRSVGVIESSGDRGRTRFRSPTRCRKGIVMTSTTESVGSATGHDMDSYVSLERGEIDRRIFSDPDIFET